jgi:hypothetical protein
VTHSDEQLTALFQNIEFADEPPMESLAIDDARRGRRGLRRWRRRVTTWTSMSVGVVALATGAAAALPSLGDRVADEPMDVAAAGESSAVAPVGEAGPAYVDDMDAFAGTRALILDLAAKHFDSDRDHLPDVTTNVGGGTSEYGQRISTKLEWKVPGENGLGLVHVVVTTPGYADDAHAVADIATLIGCDDVDLSCATEAVTGSGETVLIIGPDPEHPWNLSFAAMHERPDGSFAAVGIFTLFGNNSQTPVSDVAISREQLIAFVTDPDLVVLPHEVEEAADRLAAERLSADDADAEGDFSQSEIVAEPYTEGMTSGQAQSTLDNCTSGAEDWAGFEPVLGVWVGPDHAKQPWVIAARGDTMMLCEDTGAALFGTTDVKGSAYLIGEVHAINQTFGRHVKAVERVTVQFSGGPEYAAVMRDGYWYLPDQSSNPGPVALRGYRDGELIYSSIDTDPDTCYTDPDGTEITRYGADDSPDIEDCLPMLEWDY